MKKLRDSFESKIAEADVGSKGASALRALLAASASRLLYCWPEIRLIRSLVKSNPPSELKASEKSGSVKLQLACGRYALSAAIVVPEQYPDVPVEIKVSRKKSTFPDELIQPFLS